VTAAAAAVVAHAAARGDGPRPVFTLLLNPATDALNTHRSQKLFGCGFRLDDEERDWYRGQYMTRKTCWTTRGFRSCTIRT
jgi:acetyl esterase